MRIARQAGVGVVADVERNPGGPFAELLSAVDHLIVSQRFARELGGADEPAEAARRLWMPLRHAVVVTCGSAGCWYADATTGGEPRHFPAFAVDVVDTTGCGDVFHGVYAAGLAAGDNLRQRIIACHGRRGHQGHAARRPGRLSTRGKSTSSCGGGCKIAEDDDRLTAYGHEVKETQAHAVSTTSVKREH